MAITVGGSTESILLNSNTNPRTASFDIGTLTNGGLIVPYLVFDTTARTVSSATWNSVGMSKIAEYSAGLAAGLETEATVGILYLAAPTDGSQTLSVTLSGASAGTNTAFFPLWVNGFKQSSPLDDSDSADGDTDPSLTLQPTEDNTICVAIYYSDENNALTSDQGTQYQNEDFGPRVAGAKYIIQTTAGDQVLSWSGVDADWVMSAANFKAEPAAGGGGKPWLHYARMRRERVKKVIPIMLPSFAELMRYGKKAA